MPEGEQHCRGLQHRCHPPPPHCQASEPEFLILSQSDVLRGPGDNSSGEDRREGARGMGGLTSPSCPIQDEDIMSSMQIFENVI